MHWRRFATKDMPLDDEKAFGDWVLQRWREKDDLLEYYVQNGRFPADEGTTPGLDGTKEKKGAGYIETDVRPNRPLEFLEIFIPPAAVALVVNVFVKFINLVLRILRIK